MGETLSVGLFQPIGALLLEHCRITKEQENVFSISEFRLCVSPRANSAVSKGRVCCLVPAVPAVSLVAAGLVLLSPAPRPLPVVLGRCRAPSRGQRHFTAA